MQSTTTSVPTGREFVRLLPPPIRVPVVVINDYTPAAEREEILNALADEGANAKMIRVLVRRLVVRLALDLNREPEEREVAQRLLDAVHELSHYTDDPVDHERYSRAVTSIVPVTGNPISPITGLPKGRGDCDDLAVLFSAMARAAGLASEVIWVDQRGAPYNHIASIVCLGRDPACLWVEATIPGARVGETTPAAVERLRVAGRQDLQP